MRIAIYARVSTDMQDTERQVHDLTAWAARMGWEIVLTVEENASGAKNDRAGRTKLMNLARKGFVQAILVTELTRWGRTMVDIVTTLDQLASYGCAVRALNGMDMDVTTPHGRMIASVLSAMAEFERSLLIERIRSGVRNAQRKGVQFGRKHGSHEKRIADVADAIRNDPETRVSHLAIKYNVSRRTVDRIRSASLTY